MATAIIDRIDTLEMIERHGVVRSLTRRARVLGLTDTTYNVLWNALLTAGIPDYGSPLPEPQFSALRLSERSVSIAEGNPATADVTLKYEHLLEGPLQPFGPQSPVMGSNIAGMTYGKGRCSIVEKGTNFYYPFGLKDTQSAASFTINAAGTGYTVGDILTATDGTFTTVITIRVTSINGGGGVVTYAIVNRGAYTIVASPLSFTGGTGTGFKLNVVWQPMPRRQITTEHTYENVPNEQDWPAQTKLQVGEVKVPIPQGNFSIVGYATTTNPFVTAWSVVASINDSSWLNQPALTWLCASASWDVLRPDKNLYEYTLEFQLDLDTWDPDVVYIDQRTNLPPSLVELATNLDDYGVKNQAANRFDPVFQTAGAWKVPYLRRVDFNKLLASVFLNVQNPNVFG